MPILNIIDSTLNKIIVNRSISENSAYISVVINDNFSNNNISTIDIGGLQGPPGPPGPSGLSVIGPRGDIGPMGAKGDRGIPGSGISSLTFFDNIGNSFNLSTSTGQISFIGMGSTSVVINSNNSIAISGGSFAPINHTHTTSQILNFNEVVDNRLVSLLNNGKYINLQYTDPDFNSLTINVTGLDIGQYTQAYSPILSSISNISVGSGYMLYTNGINSITTSIISDTARSFLSANTKSLQRDFLGLGSISLFNSGDFARIVGDNFFLGNQNLGDGILSRFSASLYKHTSNTYTINQNNNGQILVFDFPSSFINVSFNSNISPGFNCLVVQANSGQVRFSGQISNRYNHTKLVGQFSIATILKIDTTNMVLSGDTTSFNSGP